MGNNPSTVRSRLVEAIDKPLGFYVLSLLIVETFIGAVAGLAKFTEQNQFYCLMLGAGLFVYITLLVTILVWSRPENITFNQAGHLRGRKPPYGTDKKAIANLDSEHATEAGKGRKS